MKASAYMRIVLNNFIPLSCEMNILERWAVFSEELKIGIPYLGCAFGGHDEIYLPEIAGSKYFLEAGWSRRTSRCLNVQTWWWWVINSPILDFSVSFSLGPQPLAVSMSCGWSRCILRSLCAGAVAFHSLCLWRYVILRLLYLIWDCSNREELSHCASSAAFAEALQLSALCFFFLLC